MAGSHLKRAPNNPLPSQEYLKELFDYDLETGVLTRKVSTSNRVKVGSEAGYLHEETGYRQVRVDGQTYRAHRLIWRWVTGDDPVTKQIDHIDRNRSNNSWSNLRLADSVMNSSNQSLRKDNSTGVTGITRNCKTPQWNARIKINKRQYQKYFKNFDDAVAWRKDLEMYREKLLLSR